MFNAARRAALLLGAAAALTCQPLFAGEDADPQLVARKLRDLTTQLEVNRRASPFVKVLTKRHLLPLCTNPVFVAGVLAQNAENTPFSEIQTIDREWQKSDDGHLPIQKKALNNACARELRAVQAAYPAIIEAFVMDCRGAIVGESNLTTDYWQGDEKKWQESYARGTGAIEVDAPAYDVSAGTDLLQVSLPILDEQGNVVGAITCGLAACEVVRPQPDHNRAFSLSSTLPQRPSVRTARGGRPDQSQDDARAARQATVRSVLSWP